MMKKIFTRNIWLLSWISLLTDVASEMLYPIMPIYLSSLGYGPLSIGVIEGIADFVSGFSKGLFGYLGDRWKKPEWFVRLGYGVSALAKPFMGVAQSVGLILTARMIDRFGKGIRTAPRDALLAADSKPENRGTVFGFHRSMDTLGATIGPLLAIAFLFYWPGQYRQLFLWSIVPGGLALLLTLAVRHPRSQALTRTTEGEGVKFSWKNFGAFWQSAPRDYKKLVWGFLLLAIVNSSDMFLLLRVHTLMGVEEHLPWTWLKPELMVIWVYVFYNLIFTVAAFPLGILSDRWGFRPVFILSLLCFAGTYGLLGQQVSWQWVFGAFLLYGIFAAGNEAIKTAWLSRTLNQNTQGTGLGLFMSLNSVGFLVASLLTGTMWSWWGGPPTLALISLLSLVAVGYFAIVHLEENAKGDTGTKLGCNSRH